MRGGADGIVRLESWERGSVIWWWEGQEAKNRLVGVAEGGEEEYRPRLGQVVEFF